MLASLALIVALQSAAPGAPLASGPPEPPETLALRLSARGVRMLISTSDDETPGRQSHASGRCYSQGELGSGSERVCLYDCEGMVAALPVASDRACPVSYRPGR